MLNRYDFSNLRNVISDLAEVTSDGKAFQTHGAVMLKARSSVFSLVLGTHSLWVFVDLRYRVGV